MKILLKHLKKLNGCIKMCMYANDSCYDCPDFDKCKEDKKIYIKSDIIKW